MSNQDSIFYKRNLAVPFFTQRDNTYIWQQIDIDSNLKKGPKYPMAWRSCNITSLCMLLHYWGLTEETPLNEREFAMQREIQELKKTNEILKDALVFFVVDRKK